MILNDRRDFDYFKITLKHIFDISLIYVDGQFQFSILVKHGVTQLYYFIRNLVSNV